MDESTKKQIRHHIARRITEIRRQKGLSQHDVASLMECDQSTLSKYENAIIDIDLDGVIGLSVALGCSIDYLLDVGQAGNVTARSTMLAVFDKMTAPKQLLLATVLEAMERQ